MQYVARARYGTDIENLGAVYMTCNGGTCHVFPIRELDNLPYLPFYTSYVQNDCDHVTHEPHRNCHPSPSYDAAKGKSHFILVKNNTVKTITECIQSQALH